MLKQCGKAGIILIKGVNHRIIEITGMDNDYFEKAILYVRPDKTTISETRIDLEARYAVGKIVPQCKSTTQAEKKPFISPLAIKFAIATVALLALTLMLYLFIG